MIAVLATSLLLFFGCQKQPRPVSQPENQQRSAAAPARTVGTTFVWECPDDYSFVASIEGDTAWLFLPGRTVALRHVRSASGTRFSDGSVTFWSHGEEARLEFGDTTLQPCRNNRARAVWEDAKLRGVSFRAVGQEPGWHLEITDGQQIRLATDYGAKQHTFTAPRPEVDQEKSTTTYYVRESGHQLEVVIGGRPCYDSMSGDAFSVTVTLRLDGQEYHGCGRALP